MTGASSATASPASPSRRPDPELLHPSRQQAEALARLSLAVEAVEALHRHAGAPRRLDPLAANALLEGFAREAEVISADVVEAAAADLAAYMGSGSRAG